MAVILFLIATNNWVSTMFLNLWEYETIKANDIITPYDIGIVLGPYIAEDRNLPIRSESVRFTQALQLYKLNILINFYCQAMITQP